MKPSKPQQCGLHLRLPRRRPPSTYISLLHGHGCPTLQRRTPTNPQSHPLRSEQRGKDYLQSQSSVGCFRLSLASELHTPKSSHPHQPDSTPMASGRKLPSSPQRPEQLWSPQKPRWSVASPTPSLVHSTARVPHKMPRTSTRGGTALLLHHLHKACSTPVSCRATSPRRKP